MILPAGENPVKRVPRTRGSGRRTERLIRRQKAGFQVNAYPALPGQVSYILDQAVAHIDHRGGAQPGRLGPGSVVRPRPAVRRQQAGRPVQAGLQQGQPGRGVPQWAGHRQHIPGPGAGAGDRGQAAQVAQGGDGQGVWVDSRRVERLSGWTHFRGSAAPH